jgi:hypothetical protein
MTQFERWLMILSTNVAISIHRKLTKRQVAGVFGHRYDKVRVEVMLIAVRQTEQVANLFGLWAK